MSSTGASPTRVVASEAVLVLNEPPVDVCRLSGIDRFITTSQHVDIVDHAPISQFLLSRTTSMLDLQIDSAGASSTIAGLVHPSTLRSTQGRVLSHFHALITERSKDSTRRNEKHFDSRLRESSSGGQALGMRLGFGYAA